MRIVSGTMLAALLGFAIGCGGKSDTPSDAKPEPVPAPKPEGGTNAPVDPNPKTVIPAAVPATWEMDPAKHIVPTGPVAGKLRGEDVTLEVRAMKTVLSFHLNKGGSTITVLELHISDPEKSTDGYTATVKPDMPAGADVPNLIIANPAKSTDQPEVVREKYSLTLKLGKREKGQLKGSLHLSLPDAQKSFVAGTFTADWIRQLNELPTADDGPFVQGKLTFTGVTDPNVWFGYVRVDPFDPTKGPASDVVGTELKAGAAEVRTDTIRPMALMVPGANPGKDPARFELTRIEPGHYWVFATVKGGPAAWKFITVDANTQATFDLAVDAAKFGSLDVSAPGTAEFVAVVPAGEKPWPEGLVSSAASIADLYVNTAANKPDPAKPLTLKFPRLAPGKYEVWSGDMKQDVEIKLSESAKVEFKKK